MSDKWLKKEIGLNQEHEQILARREALLQEAQWHLSGSQMLSSTVAQHWNHAKQRNQALLDEMKYFETVFKERASLPPSAEFVATKEKYWEKVEQELPVWKAEVKGGRSHGSKSNPSSAR